MSLMGYFSKREEFKTSMPNTLDANGRPQPDNLGIRYDGPVLNGQISVECYQRAVAEQASTLSAGLKPPDPERVHVGKQRIHSLLR